jgi:hypothetical protein
MTQQHLKIDNLSELRNSKQSQSASNLYRSPRWFNKFTKMIEITRQAYYQLYRWKEKANLSLNQILTFRRHPQVISYNSVENYLS